MVEFIRKFVNRGIIILLVNSILITNSYQFSYLLLFCTVLGSPNQKFIEGATLWIIGIHRSPDDEGYPRLSIYFQYRKCRFPEISLLLDMPLISGTESLEFLVQIIDFLL